ncbi:MAG: hypothetical protein MUE82_02640 [Chloroflexi bacterium]|jgi:hypothetical protein|nr:hypothetical protein [Chloroflexota bacterium]
MTPDDPWRALAPPRDTAPPADVSDAAGEPADPGSGPADVLPQWVGETAPQPPRRPRRSRRREVDLDPDAAEVTEPPLVLPAPPGTTQVEIIGVGLRVRGYMRQLSGGRFSDQVNLALNSLHLYEAALVDRDGQVHAILSEDLFITRRQIVLISEAQTGERSAHPEAFIPKTPREFVAVAPGFVITGRLHLSEHAAADLYFESEDPPFIPLTAVEVRGRMGEGFRARYDFALLNRQHVSAMGLRPMGAVSLDLATIAESPRAPGF